MAVLFQTNYKIVGDRSIESAKALIARFEGDPDIAFRSYAARLGITLARPESLNGSPTLAKAIADLSRQGLTRLEG